MLWVGSLLRDRGRHSEATVLARRKPPPWLLHERDAGGLFGMPGRSRGGLVGGAASLTPLARQRAGVHLDVKQQKRPWTVR